MNDDIRKKSIDDLYDLIKNLIIEEIMIERDAINAKTDYGLFCEFMPGNQYTIIVKGRKN